MTTITQEFKTRTDVEAFVASHPHHPAMKDLLDQMTTLDQGRVPTAKFDDLALKIYCSRHLSGEFKTPKDENKRFCNHFVNNEGELCKDCQKELDRLKKEREYEERMTGNWQALFNELHAMDPRYKLMLVPCNQDRSEITLTEGNNWVRIQRDPVYGRDKGDRSVRYALRLRASEGLENKHLNKDFGDTKLAETLHKRVLELLEKAISVKRKERSEEQKEKDLLDQIRADFPGCSDPQPIYVPDYSRGGRHQKRTEMRAFQWNGFEIHTLYGPGQYSVNFGTSGTAEDLKEVVQLLEQIKSRVKKV